MEKLTKSELLMIKAILIGRRSDAIAEMKRLDQTYTDFFKEYVRKLDLIIAKIGQ